MLQPVQADSYYRTTRREIEPLLPKTASRIVDVGCGVGNTAAWIKTKYPGAHCIGLEGNLALRDDLARNVDEAHIVDLNGVLPDIGAPDLVLFLDVLEHLSEPEKVLSAFAGRLAPGGTIIVSLPNVAHVSVAMPLLLFGRFDYKDSGILDRTHLRFYVRESAVALMNKCGLRITRGLEAFLPGSKSKLLNRMTLGLLSSRLSMQYIMAGIRADETQTKIAWSAVR